MDMTFLVTLLSCVAAVVAAVFGVLAWRLGRRADRRETALRDVVWRSSTSRKGFSFVHDSEVTVRSVLIVVSVGGASDSVRAASVAKDEPVLVRSSGHERKLAESMQERRDFVEELRAWKVRQATRPSTSMWAEPEPIEPVAGFAEVSAVIVWTYPSGVTDRQELSWREQY